MINDHSVITLSISTCVCVEVVSWYRHVIILLLLILLLLLMSDCTCSSRMWEEVLTLAPLNLLLHPLQILHFLGNDNAVRVLRVNVALPLYRVFQSVHISLLLSRHVLGTRTVSGPCAYHWKRKIVVLSRWVIEVSEITTVLFRLLDHWLVTHKSVRYVCIRVVPIQILHPWHLIFFCSYVAVRLMDTC